MFHPYAQSYGYVDEPLDGNRGPPLCLWSQEFYETDRDARFRARLHLPVRPRHRRDHGGDLSCAAAACPGARTITGVYRKLLNHRIGLSAICEDLPEEHNRVTLDPVLKDSHGIPAPRIDYTHQRQQPADDGARHRPGEGGPRRGRRAAISPSRARS